MAAPKRRRAKPVDAKAAKAKLEAEVKNVDTDELDAEAQAEAEAKAAAKAKKEAEQKAELDANKIKLEKIGGKLHEVVDWLTASTELNEIASLQRERWLTYGELLKEAREATSSHQLFGKWVQDNNLEFGDRNTRTAAIWMAGLPQDVIDLIPDDGRSPLINPRAIKKWWTDSANNACERAMSLGVASDGDNDKEASVAIAKSFAEAIEENEGEAAAILTTARDFVVANDPMEITVAFSKYANRKARPKFAEMPVVEAAAFLVALVSKHPEPEDVIEEMRSQVEASKAEVERAVDEDDLAELDESDEFDDADDVDADDFDDDLDDIEEVA